MSTQPILPDLHCLALDVLRLSSEAVVVQVHAISHMASCPLCGRSAERVHSRYTRTLQALPWQGSAVRVELTCRKFFCDNLDCSRRVFAEPLPGVARRYARKTTRLADALQQLTWLIGGEAAARVAHTFGLLLSADTLLYRLKQAWNAAKMGATPQALGIDDFAFRKGQRYGTILIDLSTRRPVDLLPDRERNTVETWLRAHPGASLISRDRSAVYADAIREAAPEAVQVADRFHLLKNLNEALQQQIGKEAAAIREVLLPRPGRHLKSAFMKIPAPSRPLGERSGRVSRLARGGSRTGSAPTPCSGKATPRRRSGSAHETEKIGSPALWVKGLCSRLPDESAIFFTPPAVGYAAGAGRTRPVRSPGA
jgi:hypothetical protein